MICLLLLIVGVEIIAPVELPIRPLGPVMRASYVAHPSTDDAILVSPLEAKSNPPISGSLDTTSAFTWSGCYSIPLTHNTPTGIAGCQIWGEGIASHYGPGFGVAMNFCTWEVRHAEGCGMATVTSLDTGFAVRVPIVEFCDCYTGTNNQRIVDLQYDVVVALGLDISRGLYPVRVER